LTLVRRHYADFGPTFANEKLRERHDLVLSTESLRRAMMHAGLWKPRKHRQPKLHPPRQRRPCRGELVQVDGSDRRGNASISQSSKHAPIRARSSQLPDHPAPRAAYREGPLEAASRPPLATTSLPTLRSPASGLFNLAQTGH
jgi:hypothetical protein